MSSSFFRFFLIFWFQSQKCMSRPLLWEAEVCRKRCESEGREAIRTQALEAVLVPTTEDPRNQAFGQAGAPL